MVDNVQYVHDNRSFCFTISSVKHDTTSTSFTIASPRSSHYRGSIIDESDLNAAYFAANVLTTDSAGSSQVHLFNDTTNASIDNTRLSTTETSACHIEVTGDIKGDLPTGDVGIFIRHRNTNGSHTSSVRWAGIWFDF